MTLNIPSLKSKLLEISKLQSIDFQVVVNRFGAEQFLARLARSDFVDQFIFKGGSLLVYLITTERKTRDIDFSLKHLSSDVDDLIGIVRTIWSMHLNDGINCTKISGESLEHPDLDQPGTRVTVADRAFSKFVLPKIIWTFVCKRFVLRCIFSGIDSKKLNCLPVICGIAGFFPAHLDKLLKELAMIF